MRRGDDLIATIEAIHAAGLDADLWPTALARAAEVGCGVAATLETFDRTTLRHRAIHSWGLARADELKGDRTSALETYRQLWRHYPDDKSLKTENR